MDFGDFDGGVTVSMGMMKARWTVRVVVALVVDVVKGEA
jgi:hypothetical protein